jgi:hypothetical protein
MKNLAKKITLLTLIALVQVGFVAGITEASPLHADNAPAQVQFYDGGSDGPPPPPPADPNGPPPPPPKPPHHHQWDDNN